MLRYRSRSTSLSGLTDSVPVMLDHLALHRGPLPTARQLTGLETSYCTLQSVRHRLCPDLAVQTPLALPHLGQRTELLRIRRRPGRGAACSRGRRCSRHGGRPRLVQRAQGQAAEGVVLGEGVKQAEAEGRGLQAGGQLVRCNTCGGREVGDGRVGGGNGAAVRSACRRVPSTGSQLPD